MASRANWSVQASGCIGLSLLDVLFLSVDPDTKCFFPLTFCSE